MPEILHAWAIAPAAVGACCLAADRGGVRWPELAAAALMLTAMLDAWLGSIVAPAYWAALLVAGAMALAALRGARRPTARRVRAASSPPAMALHTALGMVAMAALQLAMAPTASGATPIAHGHGGGTLDAVLATGAIGYAAFSAFLAARRHARLDRAQYAAMGAAVALMAAGSLG